MPASASRRAPRAARQCRPPGPSAAPAGGPPRAGMMRGRRRSRRRAPMHAEDLHGPTAGAAATQAPAPTSPAKHGERLRATLARAGSDLLYLTIGLGTSVLAFAIWVTAVTVSLSLAVFVVGLPAI